jgi:hypothetical protein
MELQAQSAAQSKTMPSLLDPAGAQVPERKQAQVSPARN